MYKGDFRFASWRSLLKGRRQTASTPYWDAHCEFKGRRFGGLLFEKWVKRPERAKALYWRLHRAEELEMNKYWERRKAVGSAHVTPVGGNLFVDLGFSPEEATALQVRSRRLIQEKQAMDLMFSPEEQVMVETHTDKMAQQIVSSAQETPADEEDRRTGGVISAGFDALVISDPEIFGGTPVFAGTRVPVAVLFENLADGLALDEIMDSYPTLKRDVAIEVIQLAGKALVAAYGKRTGVSKGKFNVPDCIDARNAEVARAFTAEDDRQPLRPMKHEHSFGNREALEASNLCGCFNCLHVFQPALITAWTDRGETALCPLCGLDTVIPAVDAISTEDLRKMHSRWISTSPTISSIREGD